MSHSSVPIARIYHKCCKKRFPLPTRVEVDEFQDKWNVTLPESFVDYLLEFNGGCFFPNGPVPMPEGIVVPDFRIHSLCGFHGDRVFNNIASDYWHFFYDDDPRTVVVIGTNEANHNIEIVVDVTSEYYGNIGLRTFEEFYIIAENVNDFFNILVPKAAPSTS